MRLIDHHIKEHIFKFVDNPDEGFNTVFCYLRNRNKEKGKKLLIYIDKIINLSLNLKCEGLKYSHVHLECIEQELLSLIAEFIAIKFFHVGINADRNSTYDNLNLEEINRIDAVLRKPLEIPIGAKGNSKKVSTVKLERSNLKQKKAFYEDIIKHSSSVSFRPLTILNVLSKEYHYFDNEFMVRPFGVTIDRISKERSYVVVNCDVSRDEIDKILLPNEEYLFDLIQNVILLDCEQKKIHAEFNYKDLKAWNDGTSDFKNLVIISANDGKYRFNKLKTRLDRIQSRYYSEPQYPNYESYIVMPFEIESLVTTRQINKDSVAFFADTYCSFYEDFKTNVGFYEGLYELQSFKMMNIYSLVLNESLKKILLDDIFLFDKVPLFISQETRDTLMELSHENVQELKINLSHTFDWIIQSNWSGNLLGHLTDKTVIILPGLIKKHDAFLKEIKKVLTIGINNKVTTWFDIDFNTTDDILILEYRDLGPFPYNIRPNIFESTFKNSLCVRKTFLSIFFKNKFDWASFNYSSDILKVLKNQIRETHLAWDILYQKNQRSKPNKLDSTNWDSESIYQASQDTSTIRVKFNDNSKRSYSPSELFIISQDNTDIFKVKRLEDLLDWDFSQNTLKVQVLDDLYSEFNIYEKLANVERENNELQIIRKDYSIDGSESAGRLWKVLLKRKSIEMGNNELYRDIETFMKSKSIGIVAKNTFENSWLNPDSHSLVPRGKDIFLKLCEYLNLPKSYYRLMLRLKNVEIQATRNSSKQMNSLLSDLINDGCYDHDAIVQLILVDNKSKYVKKHDFDEIGIAVEQVVEELKALVDLLRPYLILSEVQKIEMN